MWGSRRSATMLQALHFSFALGAFIAPLLAAPFLAPLLSNATLVATTLPPVIATAALPPNINTTTLPPKVNGTTLPPNVTVTIPPNVTDTTLPLDIKDTTNNTSATMNHTDTVLLSATDKPHSSTSEDAKDASGQDKEKTRERRGDHAPAPGTSDRPASKGATSVTGSHSPPRVDTVTPSPSLSPSPKVERFQYAYIIIGVLVLLTSGVFFYLLCTQPKGEPHHTGPDPTEDKAQQSKCTFRTRIIALLFVFYFLYVGGEVAYGSFVSAFAVQSELGFTEDHASHVVAVFWGSFALGRGLAICLASFISPLKMVIADLVGCVGASLVLSFFANTNEAVLWCGSAFLGLSMASLFPSGIAWLQTYTTVTGPTASILLVGSALGEMCVPFLIGYLFTKPIGCIVLMYWMLAVSLLSALIFFYVMWLAAETGQEQDSLPAEMNPALDMVHIVQEVLPMEDFSINGASSATQMRKHPLPKKLIRKKHKE